MEYTDRFCRRCAGRIIMRVVDVDGVEKELYSCERCSFVAPAADDGDICAECGGEVIDASVLVNQTVQPGRVCIRCGRTSHDGLDVVITDNEPPLRRPLESRDFWVSGNYDGLNRVIGVAGQERGTVIVDPGSAFPFFNPVPYFDMVVQRAVARVAADSGANPEMFGDLVRGRLNRLVSETLSVADGEKLLLIGFVLGRVDLVVVTFTGMPGRSFSRAMLDAIDVVIDDALVKGRPYE